MEFETALRWTEILTGLNCLIQAHEMIRMRAIYQDQGIWRYNDLKKKYLAHPKWIQSLLQLFLSPSGFLFIQGLAVLASLGLILEPHPAWALLLLANQILVAARWRGSYNGGSDYMTVLVLMILSISQLAGPGTTVALGAFWYLSLQTTLSYFIAGWVKLNNPDWRKGRALAEILQYSNYQIPNFMKTCALKPKLMLISTWTILIFEICFPFVFTGSPALWILLGLALSFHLFNAWAMGLNRFTWAWLSAYPALIFCVSKF